ncbi:MAG: hypothetical protein QG580_28 [Patescibacteria group bacterium]|jgi:phosphoribosylamine--glycine ligase|nr:hypothetical protein [Patescibacteria group bacterium]
MKILFVSKNLIGGDLARKLYTEGNEVKLFIENPKSKKSLDGIVPKTENWELELDWVKEDGLIVFDDIGYGENQDYLRKEGFNVFGGSAEAEKLEINREYGQEVFRRYGISTTKLFDFPSPNEALKFVQNNGGRWVIKQNDHISKDITYIGKTESGEDVISVLQNYANDPMINTHPVTLHQFIDGVEIGVGRYFNGEKWIGPTEINFEHKRFFPGDIGPLTSEMGTLAWYEERDNFLFRKILSPFENFLKSANFRGDFEINCIANEKGIFAIEATTRLGTPIIHLQQEIHVSQWADFLLAIAKGESFNLKYKNGYGVVILLAVPPFPYTKGISRTENAYENIGIYFENLTEEEKNHLHFEDVMCDINGTYRISGQDGYVGYITGIGDTVEEARNKVYDIAEKVIIPKVMYRNDIGIKFIQESKEKLKLWGYLE